VSVDARKIVNGQEEEMGVLQCRFGAASAQLVCAIPNGVWRFELRRDSLVGDLRLPDGTKFRDVRTARPLANGAGPGCQTGVMFEFQVDSRASFLPDSTIGVWPSAGGRNPQNLVQFIVDTAGAALPGSFKVIKSTDRALTEAARAASDRWRYRAAQNAGRPVCQLVITAIVAAPSRAASPSPKGAP
jgi:hypothetical protein